MITTKYIYALAAAAGLLAACNRDNAPPMSDQDMKAQSNDATNKAPGTVVQTKDQFLATMNKKLAELDEKIDKLAAKAAAATGDAKTRADQALADLHIQRDAVRKQFDKLKVAGEDAWEKTKGAFQTAWDGLVKTYDDTAAKLKSE